MAASGSSGTADRYVGRAVTEGTDGRNASQSRNSSSAKDFDFAGIILSVNAVIATGINITRAGDCDCIGICNGVDAVAGCLDAASIGDGDVAINRARENACATIGGNQRRVADINSAWAACAGDDAVGRASDEVACDDFNVAGRGILGADADSGCAGDHAVGDNRVVAGVGVACGYAIGAGYRCTRRSCYGDITTNCSHANASAAAARDCRASVVHADNDVA